MRTKLRDWAFWPVATLRQHCPQMPRRRCSKLFNNRLDTQIAERRTNFKVTLALDELEGDGGEYSSQQRAVALVFAVGIIVGVVINFINLHTDFQVLNIRFRNEVI